jgi:transposase InsO family protein
MNACSNIVGLARELGVSRRVLYQWRDRMEEFIERYYNVCRLHSALDYRSPEDSTAAMMTFFEG